MKIQQRYLKDQDYEMKIFVDLDSDDAYRAFASASHGHI